MKKRLLFLYIFSTILGAHAQIVPSKIQVYYGTGWASYQGDKRINQDGFIGPALYANYGQISSQSLKVSFQTGRFIHLGIEAEEINNSGWNTVIHTDYTSSTLSQYAVAPLFLLHTPYAPYGIWNKCRAFVELGPIIGLNNLDLGGRSLIDIAPASLGGRTPGVSWELYGGGKGSVGIEYSLARPLGVFTKYSIQKAWSQPVLFHDTSFLRHHIHVGVFLRLAYDKTFIYD